MKWCDKKREKWGSMRKNLSSDEIYEDLCEKIICLNYMPGEKISENDLSAQYGVSRHVIRSAITRLRARKLVDVYPQRGTFVSLLDMKYIETVLYVREAIEHEAVNRLKFLSDEKLEQLVIDMRENLVRQFRAIEDGIDMQDFYVIDTGLHRLFMTAAGQGEAVDLIREPFAHVKRWRNFEVRSAERLMEIYKDHVKITDGIEKKDWTEVNEVLHIHLNTVERLQGLFKVISPEYFIFR